MIIAGFMARIGI